MGNSSQESSKLTIAIVKPHQRAAIFKMRHDVYATELAQHSENTEGHLKDSLDVFNTYIGVFVNDHMVGFVSITPPGHLAYSMDKYVSRQEVPLDFDEKLYEVRILTVDKSHRGGKAAILLMYGAFRWIEEHGGERVIVMGRIELLDLYTKVGLCPLGISIKSGEVNYEVLTTTIDMARERLIRFSSLLSYLKNKIDWRLNFSFIDSSPSFHGGSFFEAIGDAFDHLERSNSVINADVLDAWFPPSPKVLSTLNEHLQWLVRTSPPIDSEGMIRTLSRVRGVNPQCLLAGAGSSNLIFLSLRNWLKSHSRVLILDPTYGEYAHVLEKVIGCNVDRFNLSGSNDYLVDLVKLKSCLEKKYDLVILVNPNNPTGRHIPRGLLEETLTSSPKETRFWIDETYIEYAGSDQSLEQFAVQTENVVICKSMSKVYALSGLRSAYLCASEHLLEDLRLLTPPWAVSLTAQVASVMALQDMEYYEQRYNETHNLRCKLVEDILSLGDIKLVSGVANFVLCRLPDYGPDAATVITRCIREGVYLRNAGITSSVLGARSIRIAVKERDANDQIVNALKRALK